MNAPLPRGLCPTLAAPMQTGDGLLVRLHPVTSGLSPNTLIALCEAALQHGNGIVEVTARGNLQIRGLTASSAMGLSRDVDALGIAVRTGVPVETGPRAGLDTQEIADPRPLGERLRADIAASGLAARLGPKVSVVVDGGGSSGLDEVIADLRLTAQRNGESVAWRLAVAGDAATATPLLDDLAEDAACEAVLSVLEAIAALGRKGRARDLRRDSLERAVLKVRHSMLPPSVLPDISPTGGEIGHHQRFRQSSTLQMEATTSPQPISPQVGEMSGRTEGGNVEDDLRGPGHPLNTIPPIDSRFAVPIALPFGQIRADALIDFIRVTDRLGATEIRLAPRRTLLLICPSLASAEGVRSAARAAGLVVDVADPRRSIAACAGAPACASGHIPARAIAAEIAASMPANLAFDLHISGCAKRCARPGHTGLTLLGLAASAALVVEGLSDQPIAEVAKAGAAAAIGRVAALLGRERKPGEDTAATLRRLGPARLAQEFRQAS